MRSPTPEGRFAYNNLAFHLAGIVAERAAGRPLDELAAGGLFGPLGIQDWWWQHDPEGFPLCMAGVHLRPPELARLGSLHLTGGRRGGRQLLPAGWLAAQAPGRGEVGFGCFAHSVRTADPPNRIGFGHDGYLGQWITVQPEVGIVAVRMREAEDQDLALIWEGFPADVHAAWVG